MQRLFAPPRGRLAKASPDEQAVFAETRAVIRGYFAGSVPEHTLFAWLRGQKAWKQMTLETPGSEDWSLLMSALDVKLGATEASPYGETTKRLSHGCVSYDEWVEALTPPVKKVRHNW